MLEVSPEICKLFNADRLTLYAISDDETSIISKIKTGLNSSRDLRLPISPAEHCRLRGLQPQAAESGRRLRRRGAQTDPSPLTFLKEVDKRSGYRTKQMLVSPILEGGNLYGVLQVINNKNDQPFGELDVKGRHPACPRPWPRPSASACRRPTKAQRSRATKYDGLVAEGLVTGTQLQDCMQEARNEGQPVEHLLMTKHQISAAQIGPSLAKFFGVPYEPFNAGAHPLGNAARLAQARVCRGSGLDSAGGVARGAGHHVPGPRSDARRARRAAGVSAHQQVCLPGHDPDRIRPDAGAAVRRRRRQHLDRPVAGRHGRRPARRRRQRRLAGVGGGRQRTGQVRQQGHHRRLQPESLGYPHRAHAGQAQDRHPLPHRRHLGSPISRYRRTSARPWSRV